MTRDLETQRRYLLESLRSAGIHDERVLAAIEATPRELFVDPQHRQWAYADQALPIGCGQTISQPLIVATMTQALQLSGQERVLEIGTGSGYQAAILARLARFVVTVERYQQLACQAARRLLQLGLSNVAVFVGDGSLGWPDAAPYDRIVVTAAAPQIPQQLVAQLVEGGILVLPVGSHDHQELLVIRRTSSGQEVHSLGGCVFVPLVGKGGWEE
ncbi:MAG: protein-L-isoaspartate(D-aspartate) O-methyltransferase [Thermogemmatispora sp.]|uniref:protein-L-isoaspartate(D-aspartate) O-methyltransferase n=1 Tax=Thermogemmatispora sp. TaxID=1968838 RepID=UPI002631551D|nr:protein-L-isoaspartate(D-aspartate) O-methyltransferase [Thermogemmatispora sp.]MBX5457271.1 protein-L-isoaspartate(D-aspartate) O-methyltransferase [Thermogemmatispora sp.]